MRNSVGQRAKKFFRGVALLICFIAVWHIASLFTKPMFIPSPSSVFKAVIGLAETGQLSNGLLYSFMRITTASFISMAIAVPLES